MKVLRKIKKTNHLLRSVEADSRQIINYIYAQKEQPLQFSKFQWISHNKLCPLTVEASAPIQEPLKHLLPLLQRLSQGRFFNMCSFILLSHQTFIVAYQEKNIVIKKYPLNKNKLIYWLTHIYYFRLQEELSKKIFQSEQESVVHCNEENQYIPNMIVGRQRHEGRLVKMLRISKQSKFQRNGEQQHQPYCVVYFKNGAQQLFTFQEILHFVSLLQTYDDVMFFKIFPCSFVKVPFLSQYSRKNYELQRKWLRKMKEVHVLTSEQTQTKKQIEQEKNRLARNNSLNALSSLLTLQIVAFVELRPRTYVQELTVQWLVDQNNNFYVANVPKFRIKLLQSVENPEGLATLYQKCHPTKPFRIKTYESQLKPASMTKQKSSKLNGVFRNRSLSLKSRKW